MLCSRSQGSRIDGFVDRRYGFIRRLYQATYLCVNIKLMKVYRDFLNDVTHQIEFHLSGDPELIPVEVEPPRPLFRYVKLGATPPEKPLLTPVVPPEWQQLSCLALGDRDAMNRNRAAGSSARHGIPEGDCYSPPIRLAYLSLTHWLARSLLLAAPWCSTCEMALYQLMLCPQRSLNAGPRLLSLSMNF